MSTRRFVEALLLTLLFVACAVAQQELTIVTDADAGVRATCRWDEPEGVCLVPRGGDHQILDDWNDNPRYIRVHDQNALDVGYWHFDLSGVNADGEITEARFQVDAQSNSWGDTSVMVVAIVDESEDWDLDDVPENEIFGGNAPKLDWSDWEDDPNNAMRFNSPLPFFDEGTETDAVVRQLVDELEPILIENQDSFTDGDPGSPGNSYGGFGCCDGPGTAGSADQGDNIWPVKNAVDIDITDLIRWKLGQNPGYSDLQATDRELTLMVRTEFPEFGGNNGFARFIAKESEFLGGELDLQPGRIVITGDVGGLVGDYNSNGELDATDLDLQAAEMKKAPADQDLAKFDLNGDGVVNLGLAGSDESKWGDRLIWVRNLRGTSVGDADLNGVFDSGDLVDVFIASKYASGEMAGWAEGDWNGDMMFDSGDLVLAFQDGGYVAAAGPTAVPEPSSLLWALFSALSLAAVGRSKPH